MKTHSFKNDRRAEGKPTGWSDAANERFAGAFKIADNASTSALRFGASTYNQVDPDAPNVQLLVRRAADWQNLSRRDFFRALLGRSF